MKYRRVIAARPAAHFARNHEHLTCEEKLIVFILAHPIRNTRNPPYQLTYGFWANVLKAIFNDWNTDFDCPIDPILPSRIRDYTHIDAGTLVSDHPLPDAKQGSGKFGLGKHHTRGALVKLVVTVNPETDSITFQWCDELGDYVSQSHVTLKEGKTLANLRREVIERYDYHERIRIVDHNEKLLLAFSSRAIKKWVQDGTRIASALDMMLNLPRYEKLVLASDIIHAEACMPMRLSRVVKRRRIEHTVPW